MLLEFWTWWYGPGWAELVQRVGQRLAGVWRMFSIDILLRTLFSPWKRIVAAPGKSIDQIFRGMIDNLVSRCVGFVVRLMVLIAAAVFSVFAIVIGVVMIVAWPLLPLATVFFVAMAAKP